MTIFQQKIKEIILSATPDGRINATIHRGRGKPETSVFNTILDFWEWPEIDTETAIIFSSRGLVPKLDVPYEFIFMFCSPAEIKFFVALTDAGDQIGWLNRFKDLAVALDAEQFPLETGVDLSHLIHNPKGYTPEELCRYYRANLFW